MKYLSKEPIVFAGFNEEAYERIFGKPKKCKQDAEQTCDKITDHEEEY